MSLAPSSGQKSCGDDCEDDEETEGFINSRDDGCSDDKGEDYPARLRRQQELERQQVRRNAPVPVCGETGQAGGRDTQAEECTETRGRHRHRSQSPVPPHKYAGQHLRQQQSHSVRSGVDTREYDLPTDTDTESSSLASPTESEFAQIFFFFSHFFTPYSVFLLSPFIASLTLLLFLLLIGCLLEI